MAGARPRPQPRPTLREVLTLDEVGPDRYRSELVYPDELALYGGQTAAQALVAAGSTVGEGRVPHSLHMYYLSGGTAQRPTEYRVLRDRDGRGFSARRVEALQGDRVLATVACSFAVETGDLEDEAQPLPPLDGDPEALELYASPRLFGFECRRAPSHEAAEWPRRFWCRVVEEGLPTDRMTQAAVLAYLSDRSSGVSGFDVGRRLAPVSLDHAVWFHRPVDPTGWLLMDLQAHTLAGSRGWYSGTVHDRSGSRVSTLTQELLVRVVPDRPGA